MPLHIISRCGITKHYTLCNLFQSSEGSGNRHSIGLKVTLLDEFGKIIRPGRLHYFSGLETYDEIKDCAFQEFSDIYASALKVGKMADAPCETFHGESLRTFLRQQKLAPSKSNIYVVQDTKMGVKPAKMPRLMTQDQRQHSKSDDHDDDESLPHVLSIEKKGDGDSGATKQKEDTLITPVQYVPEEDITVKELIEEGGCRPVYRGEWRGNAVAIKKFVLAKRQDSALFKEAVSDEVSVHASIRHPNIVPFYAICEAEKGKVFYLLTELMETSLDKTIFSQPLPKQKKQMEIAMKIVQGIEYLHTRNIVHGDVKPSNVLTANDDTDVKVCDFGMSRIKSTPGVTMVDRPAGTVIFMTPEELLSGVKANFKTDSWALAATLTELFTGQQFWDIPKQKDAQAYIKKEMEQQHFSSGMATLKKKNKKLFTVVEGCFSYVADVRDSVSDLRAKLEAYMREKKYK